MSLKKLKMLVFFFLIKNGIPEIVYHYILLCKALWNQIWEWYFWIVDFHKNPMLLGFVFFIPIMFWVTLYPRAYKPRICYLQQRTRPSEPTLQFPRGIISSQWNYFYLLATGEVIFKNYF